MVCQQGRWALKGGGLWDPTSVREWNESFLIRVRKPLPNRCVLGCGNLSLKTNFKTVRLMTICNEPKRTIFANGTLELLQMVLETDTGWCANENVEPSKGVDCEISHQLERGTNHSLVRKPLPNRCVLKLWDWRQYVRAKANSIC